MYMVRDNDEVSSVLSQPENAPDNIFIIEK